jgi:tRNA1(Val) A37 N6-methylase TrmN6
MTCCCGGRYPAAERQFGPAAAKRDLGRYHRKGPDAVSRLLLAAVRDHLRSRDSLLDIGGGVGVLDFELLSSGVSRATLVDASPAYLEAAGKEAGRRGHAERIKRIAGDFTTVRESIQPADVVTMNRVICCYPDYATLLDRATRHADRVLALSYPRNRWYVRLTVYVDNARRRMSRNAFRSFVHAPVAMERLIEGAGFRRVSRRQTVAWCIDVYVRQHSA